MFTVDAPPSGVTTETMYDVADISPFAVRRRFLAKPDASGWSLEPLGFSGEAVHVDSLDSSELKIFGETIGLRFRVCLPIGSTEDSDADSEELPALLYFTKASERVAETSLALATHLVDTERIATELAKSLGLPEEIQEALGLSGRLHDLGKDRLIWQRAAGNSDTSKPVAKSPTFFPSRLKGYRHELGSLLDAASALPKDISAEVRELALLFIPVHHGWARPHFLPRAFDRTAIQRSAVAAAECIQRFASLQDRYGPWTLAYLEALLRAADGLASAGQMEHYDA
jgi:hypothetical protein